MQVRHDGRSWSSRTWWAAGFAVLLSGCAGRVPEQARRAATYDLGCPDVEVARLDKDRVAASGCGRGAVYTQICNGASCQWGRLRHGHEQAIANTLQPLLPPAPREVIQAPPPEQRQVQPAPAPQQREVIPAPPPDASSAAQPGSMAPSDSPLQQPGSSVMPLSSGDLSTPYQAEVPTTPVAQQVTQAPPAPLVETRPPPPAPNYAWIGGYWWWGPSAWTWVPGYWGPSYYGYSYIPGSWYWYGGYWCYGPGGWARPGTTIIINRNLPPRPSAVATVRSFTPHRVSVAQGSTVHRVTPAPSGFSPRTSPLYGGSNRVVRTPSSAGGIRYSTPSGSSRYGAPNVGRVVSPNSVLSPRSSYGSGGFAPHTSGSSGYSAPRSYGGSYSAPRSYSPGGGSYSAPRSFSAPSHSHGGGHYSAPVRVSPGGGGHRR
jgi:hypothetical protein